MQLAERGRRVPLRAPRQKCHPGTNSRLRRSTASAWLKRIVADGKGQVGSRQRLAASNQEASEPRRSYKSLPSREDPGEGAGGNKTGQADRRAGN